MGYSVSSAGAYISYTPTYTGFSADPTSVVARYTLMGKVCSVYLRATPGTSNATSFTVTLPFAAANTAIQTHVIVATDNGANSSGRVSTRVNSAIMDVYPTVTGTSWTASGLKNCGFTITYEIA